MLRFYAAVTALIHETEDAKEGPRAFSEKRVPQFKNR
jgi:1,4-dihydroxy-2-naphthoyl-CoA synthase